MGRPLPRSRPGEQGVDARAVLATLDALDGIELHSLVLVRHGHVVAEGWWSPYTPERRHLLYSLSKSFTATAAAFAEQEGLLALDDPVVAHFPEWEADVQDPGSRSITLRHVLCMASGHTRDVRAEAFERDPDEPVRGFLLTPPDRPPGTVFAYDQPCTYALAAVVQRRSGAPLTEYLRTRLFDPLGIDPDVGWQSWPPGRELGFTGLHARTEDVAKLGLLHLQRGRWGDRQLIPADWVDRATSVQVDNPDEPEPDWRQGYGYQFWRSRHGYRGDGAFGQFCVVLPEQDAVVALTAATDRMQAVLDVLWTTLLPGLERSGPERSGDAAAEAELAQRLAGLSLPPCPSPAVTPDGPALEGSYDVRGGAGTPSALVSVELHDTGSGLTATLREDGDALTFPVGHGAWAVGEPVDGQGSTVPVAASGGWDGAVLRLEVLFLETPHRIDAVLSPPSRSGQVRWRLVPLSGDRIRDLHSP